MNRFLKYQIIIYTSLVVLTALNFTFTNSYNDFVRNYEYPEIYDSTGNLNLVAIPTNSPYYTLSKITTTSLFKILPLLVVLLSALYIVKEKGNYFKSLLIPISYFIVGSLSSLLSVDSSRPESGMILFYILPILFAMLVASSILNGLILLAIKRKVDQSPVTSNRF